jgi:hypothetical protein
LKEYAKGKNVVDAGGWYALEKKSTEHLAASNFKNLRKSLPTNFDVVSAGGWYAVQQVAADPMGLLMQLISSQYSDAPTTSVVSNSAETLNAIVGLLTAENKGFDSLLVDGEWTLVLQKQGSQSPTFQKLVSKKEKLGKSSSDFDTKLLKFYGTVKLFKGLGVLKSTVQYMPVAVNYSKTKENKIVLRRISCDIAGASWKFWKLPTLPLPLEKKGGFLDFVYMDKNIRITTGNRGGLFVHARPEIVQAMM